MKRAIAYAVVLIVAGIVTFVFAPIVPWGTPVVVDTYFTGQVSPSYYLFSCGVTYNLSIVYTENGQAEPFEPGAGWLCWHPRL